MRSRCLAVRSPARAGLGRPCHPGRTGPAPASRAARPPARHAGHGAGLAPPPDHRQVDVPEPARPAAHQAGHPRPGAAAGAGEPRLGIPQNPRRTVPARSPRQRSGRAAAPARPAAQAGSAEHGHLLARVPARSGARAAGLRLLRCGHDFPQTPLRPVRDGGRHPARARPGRDRPPRWHLDDPAGPECADGPR
jgi:hypothetical protein